MYTIDILDGITDKISHECYEYDFNKAVEIGLKIASQYCINIKPKPEIFNCKGKKIYFLYTDTDFYVGIKWVNNRKYEYLGIKIN